MRYLTIIVLLFGILAGGCIDRDVTGKVTVRYNKDTQLLPDSSAVMGTVRDQDGTPLPNAIVILDDGKTKTETETTSVGNLIGSFNFTDLSPGKYTITARRWDCRPLSKDIEVKVGTATNVAFFLTVVVEPE